MRLNGPFAGANVIRFLSWRRGWDSNPRYLAVNTLSKRAPSATRPPLQTRLLTLESTTRAAVRAARTGLYASCDRREGVESRVRETTSILCSKATASVTERKEIESANAYPECYFSRLKTHNLLRKLRSTSGILWYMPKYSVVVPFHNEEESVTALYDTLKAVMEQVGDTLS